MALETPVVAVTNVPIVQGQKLIDFVYVNEKSMWDASSSALCTVEPPSVAGAVSERYH